MSSVAAVFALLVVCAQGVEHTIRGDVLLSVAQGVSASDFAGDADARTAAIRAVMVGVGDKVTLDYLVLSPPGEGEPADRVTMSFKMTSDSSGLSDFRAQRIARLLLDCEGVSNRIGQAMPAAQALALNAGRCHSGVTLMLHDIEIPNAELDTVFRTRMLVIGIGLIIFALGCFYGGTLEAAKMPLPAPPVQNVELGERLNPEDGKRKSKPTAKIDDPHGALPELSYDIHDLGNES